MLEAPLDATWERAITETYPGGWHALTPAEKKMLRLLAQFLSTEGLLYHSDDVLDHAIRNWGSVTERAERWSGAFNLPERPTPAFLLKYPRAAVQVWLDANDLEIRDRSPQPLLPKSPKTDAPILETAKPTEQVARIEWDEGAWQEVLPESFEDYREQQGPRASRERHALHVVGVWRAAGS